MPARAAEPPPETRRSRRPARLEDEVDELAVPPYRAIGVQGTVAAERVQLELPNLAAPSLATGPVDVPTTRRALRQHRAARRQG